MSVLDYILFSLILVLLVVYLRLGHHDIQEGYSPTIRIDDEDSDLVMFLKYVYYFASVIAYFVIKWPYQTISIMINLPITFMKDMLLAVQPMVDMMLDSLNSITQMMSDAFMTLYNTAKDILNIGKDIPGLMKSMVMQFVNVAKSIFSAFGGLADAIKSMISFFMSIPTQMINITKSFATLLMKFPQMLMEFPTKGIDMMMSYTDQINAQLDNST
jgi:phage-related protein